MGSRAKGNRREREAKEAYEAAGYVVFKPQESQWDETDMFGMFDLFAMPTPECRDVRPRLSQVKSNAPRGYQAWFENVIETFGPAPVVPEFLTCYDNEGWRLIGLAPDGETATTYLDEREMDCAMGDGLAEYLQEYGHETAVNQPFGVTD